MILTERGVEEVCHLDTPKPGENRRVTASLESNMKYFYTVIIMVDFKYPNVCGAAPVSWSIQIGLVLRAYPHKCPQQYNF